MRKEWLRDEQTKETAVFQVLEGGYSFYMAGDLWSFVSAGRAKDTRLAATLDNRVFPGEVEMTRKLCFLYAGWLWTVSGDCKTVCCRTEGQSNHLQLLPASLDSHRIQCM